jgi:hypothetical protein
VLGGHSLLYRELNTINELDITSKFDAFKTSKFPKKEIIWIEILNTVAIGEAILVEANYNQYC